MRQPRTNLRPDLTLIANVRITPAAGDALIANGLVGLVAVGQSFIANLDLPARLAASGVGVAASVGS
jgi:2,4-dienoyl-CoA reductase-like NADH-dependent reductase (Old Yellow Enzyme family)